MHENSDNRRARRPRLRAAVVIVVLIGAFALTARGLLPSATDAAGRVVGRTPGDLVLRDLVVAAAYAVAVIAAFMLTIGAVATALVTARGRTNRAIARCSRLAPTFVRRPVLAACGTALTVSLASGVGQAVVAPGHDRPPPVARADTDLSGLALPDLPTPPRQPAVVLVRPGDSLWSIAAELLGPDATQAQVARRVDELYHRNLHLIGADPDRILPGIELTLRRNP